MGKRVGDDAGEGMDAHRARSRPEPFSRYTTPEFWNDSHISEQMLRCHLDPVLEAASRAHDLIDRSVVWLGSVLELRPGSRLLDLGCGPGLYANRIAAVGVEVVGIDVSTRSLEYARSQALAARLPSRFEHRNYLEDDLGSGFDAAILIYEDYCALGPGQRSELLSRIHSALLPGGRLVFDVTSAERFSEYRDGVVSQANLHDGFWAEPPYVGTEETWTYPELRLVLTRYTIETPTQDRQFWNWMQCLTPAEVDAELAAAGFAPPQYFGDVTGARFDASAPTFTVLTRRPGAGGSADG